jgi:hypothetical protein
LSLLIDGKKFYAPLIGDTRYNALYKIPGSPIAEPPKKIWNPLGEKAFNDIFTGGGVDLNTGLPINVTIKEDGTVDYDYDQDPVIAGTTSSPSTETWNGDQYLKLNASGVGAALTGTKIGRSYDGETWEWFTPNINVGKVTYSIQQGKYFAIQTGAGCCTAAAWVGSSRNVVQSDDLIHWTLLYSQPAGEVFRDIIIDFFTLEIFVNHHTGVEKINQENPASSPASTRTPGPLLSMPMAYNFIKKGLLIPTHRCGTGQQAARGLVYISMKDGDPKTGFDWCTYNGSYNYYDTTLPFIIDLKFDGKDKFWGVCFPVAQANLLKPTGVGARVFYINDPKNVPVNNNRRANVGSSVINYVPQLDGVQALSVSAHYDTVIIGGYGHKAVSNNGGQTWNIQDIPIVIDNLT